MPKKGLVPTVQPKSDFPQTCPFCEVLDSVELITYMKFQNILLLNPKFQNILLLNPEIWSKNIRNASKIPKDFLYVRSLLKYSI